VSPFPPGLSIAFPVELGVIEEPRKNGGDS
jgi:hypothetical protein